MMMGAHFGYARVSLESVDCFVDIVDDGGVFDADDVTGGY